MSRKRQLKVYVSGKVSHGSELGTTFWRDDFCKRLGERLGVEIVNMDPVLHEKSAKFDSMLIFGKDAYLIKSADLVIVNLTDDISVGGSQEMLIAKYFNKPLIGIARKGGKFVKEEHTDLFGNKIKNYVDPFVFATCDAVVSDIGEAAEWIRSNAGKIGSVKGIGCIDQAVDYYLRKK